jgi:hypothetical protein
LAAKAKGDTSSVPVVNNVIEDMFRVGKPTLRDGVMRPPPIIIKLCNRQLRLAILKNKRLSIPSPTDVERGNGIKKFIVMEDLTVPTFKKPTTEWRRPGLQMEDFASSSWGMTKVSKK